MGKLDHVAGEELRSALATVDSAKAAKRLMVALAYKDGVGVETIATRYGIPQSTVYYWLDRFDTQSLADALEDESRPGRPPKLTDDQRETVNSWLDESPRRFGYDTETWRAADLRDHIAETFDVEYSTAHVGRTFLD